MSAPSRSEIEAILAGLGPDRSFGSSTYAVITTPNLRALCTALLESMDRVEEPAARDVLAERRRQVEAEGWSAEHDDTHTGGELARAAASYAVGGGLFKVNALQVPQQVWPYRWEYKPSDDERRNLVKAAALMLAEIERIDRKSLGGSNER